MLGFHFLAVVIINVGILQIKPTESRTDVRSRDV